MTQLARQETQRDIDGGSPRRGAGEESEASLPEVIDEEAAQRAWHEVRDRDEQPVGVDDVGAPVLAHAPAGSESPWREAAEDVREQLIREIFNG